jgi:hypothetical protein
MKKDIWYNEIRKKKEETNMKKKITKRIFTLLLTAMLVFPLISCGGKAPEVNDPDPNTSEADTTVEEAEPTAIYLTELYTRNCLPGTEPTLMEGEKYHPSNPEVTFVTSRKEAEEQYEFYTDEIINDLYMLKAEEIKDLLAYGMEKHKSVVEVFSGKDSEFFEEYSIAIVTYWDGIGYGIKNVQPKFTGADNDRKLELKVNYLGGTDEVIWRLRVLAVAVSRNAGIDSADDLMITYKQ